MDRRDFMKMIGFAAAGLGSGLPVAACGGGRSRPASNRPNFVFFLVDDLGWRDLGCFGSTFYETPNVDRLATQGMRFRDAYAACPVCSPTRASIMTGKFPARLQTTDYFGAPQPETVQNHWTRDKPLLPAPYRDRLPLEEVTVAEALKQHGYATFFAGKWHLGPEGYWPENQGFDINKGGIERGGPYGGGRYFSPYDNPRLPDGPPGEHLPDRLAGETCAFIESNRDRPFLAYLAFYSVHTPLMARGDLKAKYESKAEQVKQDGPAWSTEGDRQVRLVQDHAVYAGMVEAMDQAVGQVLETLDRLDLARDTVVFFMSDNGGLSTSEGHPTSNLPLRAGKGWLYEGGVREPMIVRWPGAAEAGGVCDEPVISTDFYPTMLEMAGLPLLPRQHLDGRSLVPLLEGRGGPKPRNLYWHYPHYGNQGGSPGGAVRSGDFKLIEFYEDDHVELYDLRTDLGEKHDLSAEMPEKAAEMREALHAWRKEVGAVMPKPNPNRKRDIPVLE
jgi:arylsulfatase A-like enzyme